MIDETALFLKKRHFVGGVGIGVEYDFFMADLLQRWTHRRWWNDEMASMDGHGDGDVLTSDSDDL